MRLLLLAAALLCGRSTFAAIQIEDPQNVMAKLESVLGRPSHTQLFKAGDRVVFDQLVESCEIGCSDSTPTTIGGCSALCKSHDEVVERTVLSSDAEKAVVTGTDGFYDEITPDAVNQCRGNLALRFLSSLEEKFNFGGRLRLTKLTSFKFPLGTGTANARQADAYSVWGEFTPEGLHTSFEVKVSVIPSAPGIGQVALLSTVGQVWFRLKDY